MKIGAVVPARMGSTRLAGKVLLPLGKGTVLSMLLERLKMIKPLDRIVVATTNRREDRAIVEEARKNGVEAFCGEAEDVLARFVAAALRFKLDQVLRVTSDEPLFYYEGADSLINLHLKEKADYSSNCNESLKVYHTGMPLGLGGDICSIKALLKADSETRNKEDREHVTLFLEAHPRIFKIKIVKAPLEIRAPQMRLTLDTPEDYQLIKKIYQALYRDGPIPTSQVIKFLKDNPEFLAINRHIPAKPLRRKIIENI